MKAFELLGLGQGKKDKYDKIDVVAEDDDGVVLEEDDEESNQTLHQPQHRVAHPAADGPLTTRILWTLVIVTFVLTLTQTICSLAGVTIRLRSGLPSFIYDPSNPAQDNESIHFLEHNMFDDTGVVPGSFGSVDRSLEAIRAKLRRVEEEIAAAESHALAVPTTDPSVLLLLSSNITQLHAQLNTMQQALATLSALVGKNNGLLPSSSSSSSESLVALQQSVAELAGLPSRLDQLVARVGVMEAKLSQVKGESNVGGGIGVTGEEDEGEEGTAAQGNERRPAGSDDSEDDKEGEGKEGEQGGTEVVVGGGDEKAEGGPAGSDDTEDDKEGEGGGAEKKPVGNDDSQDDKEAEGEGAEKKQVGNDDSQDDKEAEGEGAEKKPVGNDDSQDDKEAEGEGAEKKPVGNDDSQDDKEAEGEGAEKKPVGNDDSVDDKKAEEGDGGSGGSTGAAGTAGEADRCKAWLPRKAQLWQQRTLLRVSTSLVIFSTYRLNETSVALLGVTEEADDNRQLLASCQWHPRGAAEGEVEACSVAQFKSYDRRAQNRTATFIISTQSGRVMGPCGGWLECWAASEGGDAAQGGNSDSFVAFKEMNNEPQSPPSPLPYALSVCSPLISEPMMLPRLLEWLDFHRVTAGVTHFQMYLSSDHGWFDTSELDAIKAYEAAGKLTRLQFPAFDGAFHLALQDCVFSSVMTSQWTTLLEPDEYLQVLPPNSLSSLLSSHASDAWLSLGKYRWPTASCKALPADPNAQSQFFVERAVYRGGRAVCFKQGADAATCQGSEGRRRYIFNPRKTLVVRPHEVATPHDGAILNADSEARVNQFTRVVFRAHLDVCKKEVPAGEVPEGLQEDDTLAQLANQALQCPLSRGPECELKL